MKKRLELLLSGTYSEELMVWDGLLVPIFDRFVRTFSTPESQDLKEFYEKVSHASKQKSGQTDRFSGWTTAFAYFTADGEKNPPRSSWFAKTCVLDEMTYPIIKQDSVPSGVAEVPVLVKNSGKEYRTVVVAGAVGMMVKEGGELEQLACECFSGSVSRDKYHRGY
jgi:hypothetical protein